MLSQTMENRVRLGKESSWFETDQLHQSFSNRHVREFNDEYSKTRIFSHQNILPALGTVNKPEVNFKNLFKVHLYSYLSSFDEIFQKFVFLYRSSFR